ncbi:MAG: hypothetical protein M1825_004020 [Sarcosagium campestre]|nr:MAG: hypothetical protein M1825_004020 [Sarcosagium campestre]
MNVSLLARPAARRLPPLFSWPSCPAIVSRRHESSARRTRKKLRVAPDKSFLPSKDSPQQDHIVFNPPSSAPSVYHTPLKFLPKEDQRRELYTSSLISDISDAPDQTTLPPAVSKPYEKKYHLTEKDFEEIRRLRKEDPVQWTRSKLAKKFECSQLFVGFLCEASREHKAKEELKTDLVKSRWGRKRREARDDRTKRRESWGREE